MDPVVSFYQFDYKPSVQRSAQINYGIVHFYNQDQTPWTPQPAMLISKPAQWESVFGNLGCHPSPRWIQTASDLYTLIGWLKMENEFCIHVRQMTYNAVIPFTTLIQIGTWKRGDFLISAMQLRDDIEKHFKFVLENPKILKVMCDCNYQILALQRDFNIYIYGVADICELIKMKQPRKWNYKAVCMEFAATECAELVHPSPKALVEKVSHDDYIHYATHQVHFVLRLFNKLRNRATQSELAQCFENSWILSSDVFRSPHEEVTRISPSIATTEFLRSLRMDTDLWRETLDNRNPQHISDRERRNIVALIEWRLMMSKVTNLKIQVVMSDLKLFDLSVLPNPTEESIVEAVGDLGYVVDRQVKVLSDLLLSETPEDVMKKLRDHECHNCLTTGHGPAAFCIYPKPPYKETLIEYMNRPENAERKKAYDNWIKLYRSRQKKIEEDASAAYKQIQSLTW